MSLRAYARRRGTSAPSVLRAIKRGRLKASLVYIDGVAQIADPDLADREWSTNTDHSRAPGYVKERDAAASGVQTSAPPSQASPAPGAPPVDTPEPPPGEGEDSRDLSLSAASAEEKRWRAKLAELEYRRKSEELVSAKEVADEWSNACTLIRTKILSVPSKCKQVMPELTHVQVAGIDDLLREVLQELAAAPRAVTAARANGAAA